MNGKTVKVFLKRSNAKEWPAFYSVRFLEPGLVSYEDVGAGIAMLRREAIEKMMPSFVGKPVIEKVHRDMTPENMQRHAVGYVTRVYWGPDGWAWCDFILTEDSARKLIQNGYSVSCSYGVAATGPGGEWHAIKFDEDIVDGVFNHLAIVDDPRYEGCGVPREAAIYCNSKGAGKVRGEESDVEVGDHIVKDGKSGVVKKLENSKMTVEWDDKTESVIEYEPRVHSRENAGADRVKMKEYKGFTMYRTKDGFHAEKDGRTVAWDTSQALLEMTLDRMAGNSKDNESSNWEVWDGSTCLAQGLTESEARKFAKAKAKGRSMGEHYIKVKKGGKSNQKENVMFKLFRPKKDNAKEKEAIELNAAETLVEIDGEKVSLQTILNSRAAASIEDGEALAMDSEIEVDGQKTTLEALVTEFKANKKKNEKDEDDKDNEKDGDDEKDNAKDDEDDDKDNAKDEEEDEAKPKKPNAKAARDVKFFRKLNSQRDNALPEGGKAPADTLSNRLARGVERYGSKKK